MKNLAKCSQYTVSTNLMPRLRLAFAKWSGVTHTKLVKNLAKCSQYIISWGKCKKKLEKRGKLLKIYQMENLQEVWYTWIRPECMEKEIWEEG